MENATIVSRSPCLACHCLTLDMGRVFPVHSFLIDIFNVLGSKIKIMSFFLKNNLRFRLEPLGTDWILSTQFPLGIRSESDQNRSEPLGFRAEIRCLLGIRSVPSGSDRNRSVSVGHRKVLTFWVPAIREDSSG